MDFNKYYGMTANDYYQDGRNNMEDGDYESAVENFSNAIELAECETDKTKNVISLFYDYRAECYEKMKQYDKAAKDWGNDNINSANCYREMNRFNEALEIYNRLIENSQQHYSIEYIERAKCYEKMKQYINAINDYTKALNSIRDGYSYEYEEIYHLRALCYQKMNQYDNALKDHSEAIKCNRRHKGVYPDNYFKYRANCYKEISEYKKADTDYERAINNYTKELEGRVTDRYYYEYAHRSKEQVLVERADCYKCMGKYNCAIEDYTKLIKTVIVPHKNVKYKIYTNIYYIGRGECYKILKRYDEAIQDYTKAIELIPYSNENYINRASCYMELKKYDKAVEDYTKAIKIYPYEWKYYYNRAKCFWELGEFDKMRDDCNHLINNSDNSLYDVNIKECKILYENIQSLSNEPIEIKTCTKRELMSIDGISSVMADKIIELRNNGAMWYNIETFANELKIPNHQMISMRDRFVFPQKQRARIGRKLDF